MKLRRIRVSATVLTLAALLVSLAPAKLFADDEIRLQYKVGEGLNIGNGDNLVHIQGRLGARFTYNGLEGAADNDTFSVSRGELRIDGHTLKKKLKFGFEMNLATRNSTSTAAVCTNAGCTTTTNAVTSGTTSGLATLNDYYVDYVPYDFFGIRVGQFKVPYLHQQLTSSTKQQFVDRSLATGFFDFGRDLGVDFHGAIWPDGMQYDVFLMNGDGANTINRNQGLMIGTRLNMPILGEYQYSESDVGNSQTPNFGMGLAYVFNEGASAIQGGTIAANAKASHGTLDAGFKYRGFSAQAAAMMSRSHEGTKHTNWGYNGQVGYFVIPTHLEVIGRTNATIFTDAVANQYEHAVGLNYFVAGHGIKFQLDYSLLMNNRGLNLNDHRVRTQMNLIF